MVKINLDAKFAEIKSTLQLMKGRHLTLLAKITVIKEHSLYPNWFALFQCSQVDPQKIFFFKRLDLILYDFVWNGTPNKRKRKTLILLDLECQIVEI